MGIQSNPSTTDCIPDAAPVYLFSEEDQLGWHGPSHLHNLLSYQVLISPRSSGLSTCTRQNKFLQRSCSVGGTRALHNALTIVDETPLHTHFHTIHQSTHHLFISLFTITKHALLRSRIVKVPTSLCGLGFLCLHVGFMQKLDTLFQVISSLLMVLSVGEWTGERTNREGDTTVLGLNGEADGGRKKEKGKSEKRKKEKREKSCGRVLSVFVFARAE